MANTPENSPEDNMFGKPPKFDEDAYKPHPNLESGSNKAKLYEHFQEELRVIESDLAQGATYPRQIDYHPDNPENIRDSNRHIYDQDLDVNDDSEAWRREVYWPGKYFFKNLFNKLRRKNEGNDER